VAAVGPLSATAEAIMLEDLTNKVVGWASEVELRDAAPVKAARDDCLAERRRELGSGAQAADASPMPQFWPMPASTQRVGAWPRRATSSK